MVIFDANFLLLMLDPMAAAPLDPATNLPITKALDRIQFLVKSLALRGDTIGIPTPVISEILVRAGGEGPSYLASITKKRVFRVLPFDLRAAVQAADMTATAIATGDKKAGSSFPWQKVKIDRQIASIGIIWQASTIYSDDSGVMRLATQAGIATVQSWQLPLPPEDPQGALPFSVPGQPQE